MKRYLTILTAVIFAFGCARVSVQGSKEPIKLDISMRLDIYQHVEKDIDTIEGIVSGGGSVPIEKQSFLDLLFLSAYAETGLNLEVEQAALRRKARLEELHALEGKGIVGENKMGLVELSDPSQATVSINQLISAENADRMVIYESLASTNNITVEEMQKLYAKRLQKDAPSGTPLQVLNQATGTHDWNKK
jgi:uncharacterized protein YdbL (DUF1318 family)